MTSTLSSLQCGRRAGIESPRPPLQATLEFPSLTFQKDIPIQPGNLPTTMWRFRDLGWSPDPPTRLGLRPHSSRTGLQPAAGQWTNRSGISPMSVTRASPPISLRGFPLRRMVYMHSYNCSISCVPLPCPWAFQGIRFLSTLVSRVLSHIQHKEHLIFKVVYSWISSEIPKISEGTLVIKCVSLLDFFTDSQSFLWKSCYLDF